MVVLALGRSWYDRRSNGNGGGNQGIGVSVFGKTCKSRTIERRASEAGLSVHGFGIKLYLFF